ncbi:DUF3775 domain-containing protein [Pararhodobacter sp.]|uniref:DUF3775 domain-containing protein n=1 Tax=Pararhodobacter sp. TaxID=2127056 RepID=UPI002B0031D9|nr:DUF3775 domain-containing protein [Pararhodobacter sp.]
MSISRATPIIPEITISTEQLCFLVAKFREFDVKDAPSISDPGSNASDDGMLNVLEDHGDDPVVSEIASFINAMNVDEQVDLVALVWLGRSDDGLESWDDMREEASRAHNRHTARYLLGMPLLSDYLEEAMAQFGLSCEDGETDRL